MKNAIKIVFMLSLVVILSSVAVFFVESKTTPIIKEAEQKAIEEALEAVYPDIVGSGYQTVTDIDYNLDLSGSGAEGATIVKDGDTIKAVIYTVVFAGYNPGTKYVVSIDQEGKITGYQTLISNDTSGFGKKIMEIDRWDQFTGMLLEDAGNGDFDGIVGATATTTGWEGSFAKLYEFHKDNFPVVELTPEQKAVAQMSSIAPAGSTFTKLTTFTEDPTEYNIIAAYTVNDGTADVSVIYYVEFVGYNTGDFNSAIVSVNLTTNLVDGYKVLKAVDSEDYGYHIIDDDKQTQFIDKTMDDLAKSNFDGIVGASVTTLAWEEAIANVGIYHNAEYLGLITLTFEEQFREYQEQLFPTGVNFEDVTILKPVNPFVTQIFDVTNEASQFIGTVYYVTTIGTSVDPLSLISFLVGVDVDGNFTGLRMVADTEDVYNVDMEELFYNTTFGDSIKGEPVEGEFALESALGNTTAAFDIMQVTLENLAVYHVEKYYQRPEHIEVLPADLNEAFPGADHFESIYDDFDYKRGIGNVYEAMNALDEVIGHVYIGYFNGNANEEIVFAWGVNDTGTTEQMYIISGVQSWGAANDHSDYNGSQGSDFQTSPWLENFEGVTFASLETTPVDSVSGVSETTGPMISIVEAIIDFHDENSVGGIS